MAGNEHSVDAQDVIDSLQRQLSDKCRELASTEAIALKLSRELARRNAPAEEGDEG